MQRAIASFALLDTLGRHIAGTLQFALRGPQHFADGALARMAPSDRAGGQIELGRRIDQHVRAPRAPPRHTEFHALGEPDRPRRNRGQRETDHHRLDDYVGVKKH